MKMVYSINAGKKACPETSKSMPKIGHYYKILTKLEEM